MINVFNNVRFLILTILPYFAQLKISRSAQPAVFYYYKNTLKKYMLMVLLFSILYSEA